MQPTCVASANGAAATVAPTNAVAAHVPIPANGVDYRNKIVLAPMVRSGELPSRLLALKYGADLVWGPETVDRAMIGCKRRVNPRTGAIEFTRLPSNGGRKGEKPPDENVLYRLDPVREKGKLIFQVGSGNPDFAVQAAKVVAADVSGIDLNAGCPKPFSTSGGMGAALLQTPERLASILEALVNQVGNPFQIGISVKIRLLQNPEDTRNLVSRLVKTGITGLTVHCRTTPMRPREPAIRDQLPIVVDVCRSAGVAILVNGDVSNKEHGLRLMEEFYTDGAMIASAAEANPSCFRTTEEGGLLPWRDIVHAYLDAAIRCENRWGNTKYLLNMLIPSKDKQYAPAKATYSYQDCCTLMGFDDLIPRAQAVDAVVGTPSRLDTSSLQPKQQMPKEQPSSETAKKVNATNETAQAAGSAPSIPRTKKPNPSLGPGPVRSGAAPLMASRTSV